MIWAVFAGCFLGRIGGATTFASAKVKDAIGRIGIFIKIIFPIHLHMDIKPVFGKIIGHATVSACAVYL